MDSAAFVLSIITHQCLNLGAILVFCVVVMMIGDDALETYVVSVGVPEVVAGCGGEGRPQGNLEWTLVTESPPLGRLSPFGPPG